MSHRGGYRGGRGGGRGGGRRLKKVMTQPINVIFQYLQSKARVQVWLYDQTDLKIEGVIIGFDEYLNLVVDDAEEVYTKSGEKRRIGRILLKGDNITLILNTNK
eukprot:TRINITY_DN2072_c0_g1_i1.p1 TRINITY_DN2072_c0_g1~~TRINITY_DN2072_c0_g1_i1.p1  ORF type:complete len:104 (+),score=24.03 TRINITY_DN2072_c0_g1_i1:112-423(+)